MKPPDKRNNSPYRQTLGAGDEVPATARNSPTEETWPPMAGQILDGTYELRHLLGDGGMGRVFEAYDTRLRRLVAIKVPLDAPTSARLVAEAQALAAISHPSLVSVYALGGNAAAPFLVMERIHGMTLEDHVDRRYASGRPYAVLEAVEILMQVAEGLDTVHRAGIAHHDIKPANVMLAGKRVVLMDFGLVQPEYSAHLSDGELVGSPAYMAPEVIRGEVLKGDAFRADLYSFGAMAYEMLTGELPFAADSVLELLGHHLKEAPPDLMAKRKDVPAKLASLVKDCLAKLPDDRPENAEQVLWQLRALEDHRAEEGSPPHLSVLIIDDDPDIGELCGVVLEEIDPAAQVQWVPSAEAALDALDEHAWDVLLLDMNLPGMSGFELSMYLQGTGRTAKAMIVGMSGQAGVEDVRLLQELGVSHFIPKGERFLAELSAIMRIRNAA